MSFLKLDKLKMHDLIKRKMTGTPEQFAKKMNCSKSSLYEKIKLMKEEGLPIEYCHTACTYYYSETVKLDFTLNIGGVDMEKIVGGQSSLTNYYENNFNTPDKSEWDNKTLLLKLSQWKLF